MENLEKLVLRNFANGPLFSFLLYLNVNFKSQWVNSDFMLTLIIFDAHDD